MKTTPFVLSLGTAAVLFSGLLAGPAQASVTDGSAAQVRVSVGNVKAGPARYSGACPTTVGFSASLVARGSGTVRYRWVRSDGTRSAVKTVTVKGTRKLLVRDRQTFDWEARGWQAVEIIGRKGLSRKAHFTVGCAGSEPIVYDGSHPLPATPPARPHTPQSPQTPQGGGGGPHTPTEPIRAAASVTAHPATYKGQCPATGQPVRFNGLIQVSQLPARVGYQWIDSTGGEGPIQQLDFPANGPRSRPVVVTHPVKATSTGWKAIRIVSPSGIDSPRATYSVTCDDPGPDLVVTPAAAVDRPTYTGACPTTLTFTGTIAVNRVPAEVRYQWLDSEGGAGPVNTLSFTGAPGAKDVVPHTLTVRGDREVPVVKGSGTLKIISPVTVPDTAQAAFTVTCDEKPDPTATASDMKVEPASYTGRCGMPLDVAQHILTARITVTKPMTVKYRWVTHRGPVQAEYSMTFDAPGSKTAKIHSFYSENNPNGWARLEIVDPAGGGRSETATFTTVCVGPAIIRVTGTQKDKCEVERPAAFELGAEITMSDGPASVGYRWYRKSNLTRDQWLPIGESQTISFAAGKQTEKISAPYGTSRSETGHFKLELESPHKGYGTTAFSVTCPPAPR
ncbi:hypothetical protein FHS43_004465 [Streptosporangium becharense]|uniref:Ig-like domain-containing protein n=1 Tax=Streptosporangium becharense TaxID=1816182 RepID=A0A7W9IK09_9ACTN|nr:hypothetical protein [Streptosporangium becharense]MBB2913167.1 hypothetical protein [Streptosporangium becharense]MBB5822150.1 hypothetical protein [Streptosporangium becharense]